MAMSPTTMMPTEEPRPAIAELYYLSYSWYSGAAWAQTCFWGLLISFLTGFTDPRTINPVLISPIIDRMYCCLPESIKKPLRCGVGELYVADETKDDTAMEVKYGNAAYVVDEPDEAYHSQNGENKPKLNGDAMPEPKFKEVGTQFSSSSEDSRL
eukprot:XP_003727990.1 PREDICTED: sodium-dependent multivitamin transporter [Strongylocentrotus purpuratus]